MKDLTATTCLRIGVSLVLGAVCASSAPAQDESVAAHFGFDAMRMLVVGDAFGPIAVADFDGDGMPDIACVNNRRRSIEIYQGRSEPDFQAPGDDPNELPLTPWHERSAISVLGPVSALLAHDLDGDGLPDLVYGSREPRELVTLRNTGDLQFERRSSRREEDLQVGPAGLRIADVTGGPAPEIVAAAGERVMVFPLSADGAIGRPMRLGSDGRIAAVYTGDLNGDGRADVIAAAPDESTPIRVWIQETREADGAAEGFLQGERRLRVPAVREVEVFTVPGADRAVVGVIESGSRRVVLYDYAEDAPDGGVERDIQPLVMGIAGEPEQDRAIAVADLDGDGLDDLLITDPDANTVRLRRQRGGVGLDRGRAFSSLRKPKAVTVGPWTGGSGQAVFVLSEQERTVGVSEFDVRADRLGFPEPISLKTPGVTPEAIGVLREPRADSTMADMVGKLVVVVRDGREITVEIHAHEASSGRLSGSAADAVRLKGVTRPPQSVLAMDADQDGVQDILLFAPSEPMVMLRRTPGEDGVEYTVLTDDDMPQYGLVRDAGPDNTAVVDIDDDGRPELLIAEANFVRACVYDTIRGWRVKDQITFDEPGVSLVGIDVHSAQGGAQVAVADAGLDRVVLIARDENGAWGVSNRLRTVGFTPGTVFAGAFAGDRRPTLLTHRDDAIALIDPEAPDVTMQPFASYRDASTEGSEHELVAGDINGDGFRDLMVLDGERHTATALTLSPERDLLRAVHFEVFQDRRFTPTGPPTPEPRAGLLVDATGDGFEDLVLIVHDRVVIYPQSPGPAR